MILDIVKDHVVEKTKAKEMFDALVGIFQSDNLNWYMVMRNKLQDFRMSISDNVISCLMRIIQIHDQPTVVGEKVLDAELVNVALNGFIKSWESLIKGIRTREHISNFWKRLWDDWIQGETLEESRSNK